MLLFLSQEICPSKESSKCFDTVNYISMHKLHSLRMRVDSEQEKPIKTEFLLQSFYYKSLICKVNLGQGQTLGQGQILGQGQNLGSMSNFGSRSNLGQGQILDQGEIVGQGLILGQSQIWVKVKFLSRSWSRSMCVCVWLHLASPDGQCLCVVASGFAR